jgi:hypothetical protein
MKEWNYGNSVGPVKNIILYANMNMCNEYFVIWWKFGEANHLQNFQIQVHVKVETWQKSDKNIIVGLKTICDVLLQQIVGKFCASVYNEQYYKFEWYNEQSINVKRNSKGIVDVFSTFSEISTFKWTCMWPTL